MATRTKTIRIPVNFNAVTDVADATLTTLGVTTIFTPENSVSTPITFESVMVFFAWQNTTISNLISFQSTLTLAGSSASATTVSGSLLDTGEDVSGVIGPIDYTSYFTSNYGTVTSKNLTVQVNIDNEVGASRGVYCYLEVTYQIDDSVGTQIQTICIPYEFSGSLATTQTTVETLPQLTGTGGFLSGYSDLNIRYRWIHIKGNTNVDGTTGDITPSFSFDNGGTTNLPIKEQGGGADNWVEYQIQASGLTTNATHTFELWTNVANRFTNIIISEWITYDFTTSGTTEVVNYFEYPIEFTWPIKTSSTEFSRYGRNIIIPEPSTITMLNCVVEIYYNTIADATVQIRVGSQNFSPYAMQATLVGGAFGLQHRFDSGSGAGSGLTLTKGSNQINVDLYQGDGELTNLTGTVKLLYKSGVASVGIASHSRTVNKFNSNIDFNLVISTSDNNNFDFLSDEINYYIHGIAYQIHYWVISQGMFVSIKTSLLPGELDGGGYDTFYSDWYDSDNEIGYTFMNTSWIRISKLYAQQPVNLLDPTQTREFLLSSINTTRDGSKLSLSYHNVTSIVSGNITGSNGGEIALNIYQEGDTGEYNLYQTKSVTGNTTYSFDVYDDTVNYQVVAYESTTLKGVSKVGTPAIDFDISLTSGGEYGFAFG